MSERIDLSGTTDPKSDQLNADDLNLGPRTIVITRVKTKKDDPQDQKTWLYFKGDNGKPYKPCKTIRRVLIDIWGTDGAAYVGRKLTLFRDPTVRSPEGGIPVGGIRVSHASHIEKDMAPLVTVSRGKKAPYPVKRLETGRTEPTKQEDPKPAGNLAATLTMIETWSGDLATVKTKLAEFSWTDEERAELKKALGGKGR